RNLQQRNHHRQQPGVLECAVQLREIGDFINWRYKVLDLLLRTYSKSTEIK
uniref:Uncharacterized protein n=1 Tax=Denticeps clupeoides TaxID=299321 RepID=A0AAY4EB80_9TELE